MNNNKEIKQTLIINSSVKSDLILHSSNSLYFLLSMDTESNSVFDVLQIPNLSLTEDFEDIIKFILPYGNKILGVIRTRLLKDLHNKLDYTFEIEEDKILDLELFNNENLLKLDDDIYIIHYPITEDQHFL